MWRNNLKTNTGESRKIILQRLSMSLMALSANKHSATPNVTKQVLTDGPTDVTARVIKQTPVAKKKQKINF